MQKQFGSPDVHCRLGGTSFRGRCLILICLSPTRESSAIAGFEGWLRFELGWKYGRPGQPVTGTMSWPKVTNESMRWPGIQKKPLQVGRLIASMTSKRVVS